MNKAELYKLRRRTRQQMVTVRDCLMHVANQRRDEIRDYVNLNNKASRGRFYGLSFNMETLRVEARWDYYEGHYTEQFPQELLWSSKPLDELRQQVETRQQQVDRIRVASLKKRRDELLAEFPLEED